MFVQKVRFDRVFSVYKRTSKRGKYTDFCFEIDGKKCYQAKIFAHADLQEGRLLALAMPKENDWSHIYGAMDCDQGNLYVTDPGDSIWLIFAIWLAFAVLVMPLVVVVWRDALSFKRFLVLAMYLLGNLHMFGTVLHLHRQREALRVLKAYSSRISTALRNDSINH